MADDRSLETVTAEDFAEVKGSRFRLMIEPPRSERPVVFEFDLAAVTPGSGPSGAFRQPFTVLFHGPIQPVLPQGIYRLEHDKLGVLELFIVPVGPDEPSGPGARPTAMRYEAVFG